MTVDTLKLAEDLEKEHVFSAEQARAFSRIIVAALAAAQASKGDLDLAVVRMDAKIDAAVLRLEAKIADSQKELVKWFAAIMIVQGLTVIGGTATLVNIIK